MRLDRERPGAGFTGVVHAMPYTHADIAWVHTRAWHVDRYVRVMDEVLRMFEADPDYHYYIDTWVELMKPYLDHHPGARAAIRKYVGEGRLAVCGGQFGNMRSTAIGNETQIRNMQIGMRRWSEAVPEARFRVHSNIDVTLGHTQMPQLLTLAGIEAYFVMRPIAALDAQGIPRTFLWRGLSGHTIMMIRDTGVGLFQEHERCGPTWDANWDAAAEHIWKTYLAQPAKDGTAAVALSLGVDDSRPDRFAFTDEPADYGALIRTWNEREASTMRYGTPDTLLDALGPSRDSLPVVAEVLDPTDVSFNIALHGRRGIWWLRERADRVLVEAEALSALAVLAGRDEATTFRYPEAEINALWETLLTWTPHAVQWLFLPDWEEGELALRNVAASAERLKAAAASALVGEAPHPALPRAGGGDSSYLLPLHLGGQPHSPLPLHLGGQPHSPLPRHLGGQPHSPLPRHLGGQPHSPLPRHGGGQGGGRSSTIALINPMPEGGRAIVPLWIVNTDLTRGFAGLRDAQGAAVPVQVTGYPVPVAETACLAEVELVGCGSTALTVEWEPIPRGLSYEQTDAYWRKRHGLTPSSSGPGTTVCAPDLTLASDTLSLRLAAGRIVGIEDLRTGSRREAPAGMGYLDPLSFSVERTGWSSDGLPGEPERFEPDKWTPPPFPPPARGREGRGQWTVDESGPLRWRVTRTGRAGEWWVRQHIDLHKGEGAVRSTIRFVGPGGDTDSILAVGTPAPEGVPYRVDIPFGVEPRPVDDSAYGISERAIPGLFWGRTWAAATDDLGTVALVAADGDKLFRSFGSPRRLAHIVAQKTRMFEKGWERHLGTHDVGGNQEFVHVLWLSGPGESDTDLVRLAERLRHPVAARWAPDHGGDVRRLVAVSPETVFLSALRFEGRDLIVRVVQMSPSPTHAAIEMPVAPRSAALVNLRGEVISSPVERDGCVVRFAMGPWQIATLRVSFEDPQT